jgi:hypothetical protein
VEGLVVVTHIPVDELLSFALANYAKAVTIVDASTRLQAAVPGNAKKGRSGFVSINLPEKVVRRMKDGQAGVTFLVEIPFDVIERFASPIVTPEEKR